MAEIQQLSADVADRISAGEVIERPASVVKELVENSIDAGSEKISITVNAGGKDRIQVRDDGHGITGNELELAFQRYATSKIDDVNDLYALRTLGFRGEALASIASVARVKVKTRREGEDRGHYLYLKGGEVIDKKPIGCPAGTDITITDLFYNTPARYKYLKTTNTEFGHISTIVNREALAYPEISFKLEHNGKGVFQTPGSGNLKDCIYSLYGRELTEELIRIDFTDKYIDVSGYIANPNYNRSSRIHELFFVNKRAVNNQLLNKAVEEAYRGLLPPGKRPVVFLFLRLNPILVDVNVHPTKKEVRFSRGKMIKQVLTGGLKKVLSRENTTTRMEIREDKRADYKQDKLISEKVEIYNNDQFASSENGITQSQGVDNHKSNDIDVKKSRFENTDNNHQVPDKKGTNKKNSVSANNENRVQPTCILGQIHNTYIIVEATDGLLIIDQHTAHERVLYDDLQEKIDRKEVTSQQLLIPVQLELTVQEQEIIKKYRPEFKKLGFSIEQFSSKSFIIREVPTLIKDRGGREVIREIIDKVIQEDRSLKKSELIENILQYMSCRGAVKAGDKLEREEIQQLIEALFQSSNPYRCPHQRPIILHLDKKHLERSMGRR